MSNTVEVEMVHALSKQEKECLKTCIGKNLEEIICPGARLHAGVPRYELLDTLSLKIKGLDSFISISTRFSETNFGDDFNTVRIAHTKYPEGIRIHETGALQHPFTSLYIGAFLIDRVEVYGYSYEVFTENKEPEPFWGILRRYKGKSVKERIETENILVFCSGEKTMMLNPSGPVEAFDISFDERPLEKNLEGHLISKLKYAIQ